MWATGGNPLVLCLERVRQPGVPAVSWTRSSTTCSCPSLQIRTSLISLVGARGTAQPATAVLRPQASSSKSTCTMIARM